MSEAGTPTGVHQATEAKPDQTFFFASIGRRFVALLIDGILVGIVTYTLAGGKQETMNVLQPIANLAYHTLMIGQYGYTIGKRAMGIVVVNYDGNKPDWTFALIRALIAELSTGVFLLGYIWAFFNPKRQTWHDLAARTYVVDYKAS